MDVVEFFSISIHAPLAGCDLFDANEDYFYIKFQSTHPLRGATFQTFGVS